MPITVFFFVFFSVDTTVVKRRLPRFRVLLGPTCTTTLRALPPFHGIFLLLKLQRRSRHRVLRRQTGGGRGAPLHDWAPLRLDRVYLHPQGRGQRGACPLGLGVDEGAHPGFAGDRAACSFTRAAHTPYYSYFVVQLFVVVVVAIIAVVAGVEVGVVLLL